MTLSRPQIVVRVAPTASANWAVRRRQGELRNREQRIRRAAKRRGLLMRKDRQDGRYGLVEEATSGTLEYGDWRKDGARALEAR